LTESSRSGDEQFTLAAASLYVVERHLSGVFGSALRAQQGLPFLRKPWAASDVAAGYSVSGMCADGYRQLIQEGVGPVAVAREKTTSLIRLVPLSHFLQLATRELEASFLSKSGAPLMAGESYAPSGDADEVDSLIKAATLEPNADALYAVHRRSNQPKCSIARQ
jgi:hypothetical protein